MDRLPLDVIYHVTLPFLYLNENCCKLNSTIYMPIIDNKSYNIYKKDEPKCTLIEFENKYWCLEHNTVEYYICEYMKTTINSNRLSLQNKNFNEFDAMFMNKNILGTDSIHIYDIKKKINTEIQPKEFQKLCNNVLKGTSYGISHSCCNGKGVMFGKIKKI